MTEQQLSYRQIFKATSLFGGVQVFLIIIGIVRVKFVAVLLGTAGVGIIGLLNAPVQMIVSLTGLGLSFSAVRDVSEAYGQEDQTRIARTIITLRSWSWFTGFLGATVTIAFAPLLSQWSFGNKEYTWAFVWLSITLLLQAVSKGQSAILQGTRRLKEMAKASVIGSTMGLIVSLPLYYLYGIKGIVPAMLLTALTTLILSWYFSHSVKIQKVDFSIQKTFQSGLGMAKLGISMTIAGFIASFSTYILNSFISNNGNVDQVGLYNSGWGVVAQYTNPIFSAMATDYFPRLSAIQSDMNKIKELVRQQTDTALLIMTPLLSLLIIAMPLVVRILYTPAFLPVVMFASLTVLGIQFKSLSWAMGYVTIAKGDSKLFLILEIISGVVYLILNLVFYYYLGLNGLGISFILNYLVGALLTYAILKWKYNFSFPIEIFKRLLITNGFMVLSFLTIFISGNLEKYAAGIIVLVLATCYSLIKLNDLMDLKALIIKKTKS